VGIDPHGSGFDFAGGSMRLGDIARPDTCGETVRRVVGRGAHTFSSTTPAGSRVVYACQVVPGANGAEIEIDRPSILVAQPA
jgi:hypothetical protein